MSRDDFITPTSSEILDAIKRGVWESFPYSDLILEAIEVGCKDGVIAVHREAPHRQVRRVSRRVVGKESIPYELRWAVFERDDFTCQNCGTRKYLSADHIVPESQGGKAVMSNLQTLCRSCNSKKGTSR